MLETSSLFWLLTILIVTENFDLSRGILVEKWIQQYQDHFDYYNDETWLMRYYENDEFYHHSGPVFIMIGGENSIMPVDVSDTCFMYEMAKIHGAMMYAIEHRYYGKSHPVPDTSTKNLRYLSVSQTLADIAMFIEIKKRELNNPNAFIMVFGGSYAGNLAAWMRIEYPNLVHGALASSAPIYVKLDHFEYYELAENSLRKYDENCPINIKKAFSALEELLKNPMIYSIMLKNDFKLCSIRDFFQSSGVTYMVAVMAYIILDVILNNKIENNGKTSIENLCNFMRVDENRTTHYRLAEAFKKKYLRNGSCINMEYNNMIEDYLETSWESSGVGAKLWLYQTCNELGYYHTSTSLESLFGSLIPLRYFINKCKHSFTQVFNLNKLNHNIREIDRLYNSKLSNTTNIIFTNGDLDPWRSISVLSDLNTDSPAIIINGASHSDFLIQNEATQPDSLIIARCQVSFMIYEWLHTYKNLHE